MEEKKNMGKPEAKRPLGRFRCRRQDVKMDLKVNEEMSRD